MICTPHHILFERSNQNDEICVTCSKYGEKVVYRVTVGKPDVERLLVRRRLMLKWIFKTWDGVMD